MRTVCLILWIIDGGISLCLAFREIRYYEFHRIDNGADTLGTLVEVITHGTIEE